jgi:hypothetical protein
VRRGSLLARLTLAALHQRADTLGDLAGALVVEHFVLDHDAVGRRAPRALDEA